MTFEDTALVLPATAARERGVHGAPDVLGDFLVGIGARAAAFVADTGRDARGTLHASDGMAVRTRGAVRVRRDAGRIALGLADLVVGSEPDAFAALEGRAPWPAWRGRFAQVAFDPRSRRLVAAVDHFSTLPLCWLEHEGELLLATDARALFESPWCDRAVDPVALYHYLNFAVVPAPGTLARGVRRLEPAAALQWRDGRVALERWWRPEYPESRHDPDDALARELRERIEATVERYRPAAPSSWGTFLSGGTDSTSIASILARGPEPVHTFSIGFAEEGYDELEFARIAARECGAVPHTDRVDRARTLATIPRLAELYDQPFGNASAVPTHACASLAAQAGRSVLLAGDGGDEIFGGNERYAKDAVMERFHRLPGFVRALARAGASACARTGSNFANRVRNFVRRASLPNPARFYTDDAFASEHRDTLLTPAFAREVEPDASLDFMRGLYARCDAAGAVHRLMALDLELAIARNDLVKVHGAARGAGVTVRFPYLDPDLVAFTGTLPPRAKLNGFEKRWLFKRAMREVLPQAVLTKPKQGFGLPISVWLARDAEFRDFTRETLTSARALGRGWFRREAIDSLVSRHVAGEWDWSAPLWQLLMLELWLERNLDGAGGRT